jgi:hypothetical protein
MPAVKALEFLSPFHMDFKHNAAFGIFPMALLLKDLVCQLIQQPLIPFYT